MSESTTRCCASSRSTVRYGAIHALRGVSFDVRAGEIVTLIGSNGAGKSTLLRAICGLLRPSAGRILLRGADVTRSAPDRRSSRSAARTCPRAAASSRT